MNARADVLTLPGSLEAVGPESPVWWAAMGRSQDMPDDVAQRAAAGGERELGRTVAVVSTDTLARDGIILNPKGWTLRNFRQNPVVLVSHGYGGLPVGTAKVRQTEVDGRGVLLADIRWDMDDPEGARVAGKYHRGVMRAFSVGFRIDRRKFQRRSDLKPDHAYHGEHGYYSGSQDLLEVSAAAVGVDAGALARSLEALAPAPGGAPAGVPDPAADADDGGPAPSQFADLSAADRSALRALVLDFVSQDPDMARAIRSHFSAAAGAAPDDQPDGAASWTWFQDDA